MTALIRKKFKIDTRVKMGIIVLLSCSTVFLSFGIYREVNVHKVKNEEKTAYQYTCQPKAEYLVHIHENSVYEGTVQEENLNYSKKLLDYIEVKFGTEFQGSEEAETEFIYHITAQVQGFENLKGEAPVVNWRKNFELAKETKKITSETNFTEEKTVRFNLDEYDAFALEAREVTGMELSSQVVVLLEGNLNISTKYGNLSTPIQASITVPLQDEVFSITKEEIAPINDNIINNYEVPLKGSATLIFLFSVLLGASIIGILFILLATEAPNAYDLLKTKTKKLIKNYGSRMIVIQNKTEQNYLQTYELGSIEDLIKVSDEIQKPIYYMKDDIDIIGDYLLEVADGDSLYVYHIV
jgi:hypothetical protein